MGETVSNFARYVTDSALLHPLFANTADPRKIKQAIFIFMSVHIVSSAWAIVTHSRMPALAGPVYMDPLFNVFKPLDTLSSLSSPYVSKLCAAALVIFTLHAVVRTANPLSSRAVKRFFLIGTMLLGVRLFLTSVTSIPSPDPVCANVNFFLSTFFDHLFFGNCGGSMFDTPTALATLAALSLYEGYDRTFAVFSVEGLIAGGVYAATIALTLASHRAYSIDVVVAILVPFLLWNYYHLSRRIRPIRDSLAERSSVLAYTEGLTQSPF